MPPPCRAGRALVAAGLAVAAVMCAAGCSRSPSTGGSAQDGGVRQLCLELPPASGADLSGDELSAEVERVLGSVAALPDRTVHEARCRIADVVPGPGTRTVRVDFADRPSATDLDAVTVELAEAYPGATLHSAVVG